MNINFSTLCEMYSEKTLSKAGVDKYVRGSDKPPVKRTAIKAVEDKILPADLVQGWIDDGILAEGSTRASKGTAGFIDKQGNHCLPSFYMKGSSRSTENWTDAMNSFKSDYYNLIQAYTDKGLIVDFN